MLIRFWGTRGSLPAPLTAARVREKLLAALEQAMGQILDTRERIEAFVDHRLDFATAGTYGGNTSCVEIDGGGDEYLLCDLGTGVREFGNRFLGTPHPGKKKVFNVLMSHLHWDHVMGFPLFAPAYMPGHRIVIHGCHEELERAFRTQHSPPGFPVDFDALLAEVEFVTLEPGRIHEVGNFKVRPMLQHHGGDSYGYRIEAGGKSVVYATDAERSPQMTRAERRATVDFFRNADVVIFDAMYSLAETMSVKRHWGHSSNIMGVELCLDAGVRHYCMFHHEPLYDDATLSRILEETREYESLYDKGVRRMVVTSAYDGMEMEV